VADASVARLAATIWSRASEALPDPVGVRKAVARRVGQGDASVAALAGVVGLEIMWTRHEWLVAVAADLDDDAGYLARIEPPSLGPRSEWTGERSVPFETDIAEPLAPVRIAMLGALRLGLREAATRRRRAARRHRRRA
jgi:hypothetical protein